MVIKKDHGNDGTPNFNMVPCGTWRLFGSIPCSYGPDHGSVPWQFVYGT